MTLSDFEKGEIETFHKEGLSNRDIAKKLDKASSVVDYYFRHTKNRVVKKKPGRKPTISSQLTRRIQREVSNTGASTTSIKRSLSLQQSKSTFYRVIVNSPYFVNKKMKQKPPLTQDHKHKRLAWAHARMQWVQEWKKIIWTDEKKFNSDGPDGYRYYWHDIRKEETYLSRRQQGGPSVMVWTGFGADGKCNIAFLTGKVNAAKYQLALESHFLPFRNRLNGKQIDRFSE